MIWDQTSFFRCLALGLTMAVSVSWGLPPNSPRTGDGINRRRLLPRKQYREPRISSNNWPRDMRHAARDQSDEELSKAFLNKYGYFRKGKPLGLRMGPAIAASRTGPESDTGSAIRMFQNYFGLNPTGRLDKETTALMKKSRCGVADIPEELKTSDTRNGGTQTPSEFELLGSKWDHSQLTWKLSLTSNQLGATVQRETLRRAFSEWNKVAPLDFHEVRRDHDRKVDIDIQFGRKDHGDAWPFDGKGWVLAHAFGPGTHDLSGDMHIDEDENWAEAGRAEDGSNDLLLVAVHELGHSLGLSHSSSPDAIMYPYYGVTDKIGDDDIRAIQSLYGARIEQPRTTSRPTGRTTTPRPTGRPNTRAPVTRPGTRYPQTKSAASTQAPWTTPRPGCEVQFDVVLRDDIKDVYTGIQGDQIYQFNKQGLLPGYPTTLRAVFPGAPANAEAIFTVPEKSATYFVKENRVWRFQRSQLDPEYPKKLPQSHFPETIRFIVSLRDSSGSRRIFVFGRTNWFEYNFDELPTFRPRLHVIAQYWPAITTDVRYVVTGHDSNMYLISQHSHVVLDSFRRTLHGGKQKGHPKWLQPVCPINGPLIGGSSGMTVHRQHQWTLALVSAFTTLLILLTKF